MLALVLCFALVVVARAHDVPLTSTTFCADVNEALYVNGTKSSSHKYNLCLDSAGLNWKQTMPDGSFTMVNSAANEGLGWYYAVNARGECTKQPPAPLSANDLPFTMVKVDSAAHRTGASKSPDSGIESAEWVHQRPSKNQGGVSYPAEDMSWWVHEVSGDAVLVETACAQQVPDQSDPNYMQSGNRDFSTNFDAKAGAMAITYAEPAECVESLGSTKAFQALF